MNRKPLAAIQDVGITATILAKADVVILSLAPASFTGCVRLG